MIANPNDPTDRDLLAVSVFATVWKTMQLFEGKDALGRKLTWAFDGPQLFVVPRAGRMVNAYYERASRSVQFFYFPSSTTEGKTIYSCASRDIVAHETAHAILDGILPDPTPQAVFERFGDIALQFRLYAWIASPQLGVRINHDLHMRIDRLFRESRVSIDFANAQVPPPLVGPS